MSSTSRPPPANSSSIPLVDSPSANLTVKHLHKSANSNASTNLGFRYVWPVKVCARQLGANGENTILHISPKFATVHEHVSFQWTLKMYGTPETGDEEEEEKEKNREEGEEEDEDEGNYSSTDKGYVAISLYYLDGPVSNVELKAQVRIAGERRDSDEKQAFLEERNCVSVCRGHECELSFKDRAHLTGYIRQNIGHLVRLSLLLELDAGLFRADNYLNAVSPTPYHSFLTTNYRARAGSKVWRKKSNRRPRSASDGHALMCGHRKLDLERVFNRVMEREREEFGSERRSRSRRASSRRHSTTTMLTTIVAKPEEAKDEEKEGGGGGAKEDQQNSDKNGELLAPNNSRQNSQQHNSLTPSPPSIVLERPPKLPHVFKKLLIACCESCERRASLIPMSMATSGNSDDEEDGEGDDGQEAEEAEQCPNGEEEEENTFECDEESKAEIHDTLANMYFNRVVLPEMEYVEDFVDFLIDAELNDLPVLKRACERYLCGELDSKKELMTSLILDFFFIAMVFQLPVMKSMTLTELCERYSELEDVDKLLEQEEYRNIDKWIRQLCGDRNLHDLVDECKRFREQCLRVQCVDLSRNGKSTKKEEMEEEGMKEKRNNEEEEEDNKKEQEGSEKEQEGSEKAEEKNKEEQEKKVELFLANAMFSG